MDTTEVVENVLIHFGVRGQKWGVRRKATVGAQEVVISDKRIGKGIKTTGGQGHSTTSEAASSRQIAQIGKKSGLKALSNKQLQEYNNRLNLEQNTKRLMYEDSSMPVKVVKSLLRQTGKKTQEDIATDSAKKVKRLIVAAAMAA